MSAASPPTTEPTWGESGTNTEPDANQLALGYIREDIPTFDETNWLYNLICRWIRYLYARQKGYTTLQALYAGLSNGDSGDLYEDDSFYIPGVRIEFVVTKELPVNTTQGEAQNG